LSAIGIDSNHNAAGKCLNNFQRFAARFIIVESVSAQASRAVDEAQERFTEGEAPGSHGPQVAITRERRAIRMRVQEADDIAVGFFAFEHPKSVESHAGPLALFLSLAVTEAFAEQNPALLDFRYRGGCTRQ
jgi:hypothetical protein